MGRTGIGGSLITTRFCAAREAFSGMEKKLPILYLWIHNNVRKIGGNRIQIYQPTKHTYQSLVTTSVSLQFQENPDLLLSGHIVG